MCVFGVRRVRVCVCVIRHKGNPKVSEDGAQSDEENEEGDFTVYECPGLAPVRMYTHAGPLKHQEC